jgi:2,3-dihydroxy-p-cumate/2,3-dihydroxybenzoate 3,4-dioxygenase
MVYEYSVGVKHILPEEEASYRPRQFPFAPESFCMWGARPDIPEFREDKKYEGRKNPSLKTVA